MSNKAFCGAWLHVNLPIDHPPAQAGGVLGGEGYCYSVIMWGVRLSGRGDGAQ